MSVDGTDPESQVGRVLSGRYRIHEPIATGGMGAVFVGEHIRMKKRVAIKLLLPHAKNHPQLVERFEREAVAGAQVSHENVAAATDFGQEEDGTRFLVMEHVAGPSLAKLIADGPMAPERAMEIASDVAAALEAIHERGIVHRDLKPANVIVGDRVKVIDFGFAKVDEDRLSLVGDPPTSKKALTTAGDVFGTVRYMAPEVVRGMGDLDGRADLYALGVILYEMLAGQTPFDGKGAELFAAIRTQQPPPIAERSPNVTVPPAVEALAMQLLAKKPDERFASASALRQALAATLADGIVEKSVGDARVAEEPVEAPAEEPTAEEPAAEAPMAEEPPAEESVAEEPVSEEPLAEEPVEEVAASSDESDDPPPASGEVPPPKTKGGTVVMLPSDDELKRGPGILDGLRSLRFGKSQQLALAAIGPALAVLVLILWIASGDSEESDAPEDSSGSPSRVERPSYAPLELPDAAAPARPTAVGGMDAMGWRQQLLEASERRAWMKGAEALLSLGEIAPEVFDDGDVRRAAVRVAVGMGTVDNDRSARVFLALGDELGESGLSVLYELLATKGGTKAWKKTRDILREPARQQRMSPALRVAYDLRTASCEDKAGLFGRAAEEGDGRALKQLQILQHARCREGTTCCYRDSEELLEAIAQLEAR